MNSTSYKQELDKFPIRNHFRLRGSNMSRIEVFTDAAFAFTITLVVVSLDGLPSTFNEFIAALKDIPAFAASFAQLAYFWYAHRVWSQRYGLEDLKTIFISCLLIFCVLVFVFPLKISYSIFFYWLTSGYLPAPMTLEISQLKMFFSIFHIAFLSMCLTMLWLYRHALNLKTSLYLNNVERFETVTHYQGWFIMSATSCAALLLALVLPAHYSPYSGMLYATFGLTISFHSIKRGRQMAQLIK